jgi:hypothetical protein
VLRLALMALLVAVTAVACRKNIQDKDQVRRDLIEYLSTKVGLDLKALDVDVTKVTFTNDEALATVSFHQKNDPSIGNGMVMNYRLQPKDGHWVVKGRADSQGRGFQNAPADQNLPPGHPSVQGLPPGHPSVDKMQLKSPAGASEGQQK